MKKGFTLIELIAVLVMIALLIAVVLPNVSNLMKDQNKKKYDLYYTMVNEAVDLYAETRRDDLGGVEAEGCVNDFTIGDLIEEEYIKYFDSESDKVCRTKNIYNGDSAVENCTICGSPGDFSLSFLRNSGYEDTGFESNVRITNKEGRISKEVAMVCIKNNKIVYEKKIPTKACNKYVAANVETVSLLNQLSTNVPNTLYQNNLYFINGSATNNYIWYSGKLWRAISFNKENGLIKLVTEDPVTTITYDRTDSFNEFKNTNIGIWLNTVFYQSLRNPTNFIVEEDWYYGAVSSPVYPTTGSNKLKVGLLNYFEYDRVNGFLNTFQKWWLLSNSTSGGSWYINDTNAPRNISKKTFYGVRPSIVLKPNISFNKGGTGTVDNPYVLKGEGRIVSGVLLKDRMPGEYVRLNNGGTNYLFRIVSTSNDYTRLILDTPLNITNMQFHYDDTFYSSSSYIGAYLNTWKGSLTLVNSDFCRMNIDENTSINSICPKNDLINIDIGIPKIGDMFTTSANREYWTLSNYNSSRINVIEPSGTIDNKGILDNSGVRPVINLGPNVRVSGAGTLAQPYTLS